MHVALIIPTIGRPDDLDACLRSIAREADDELLQVIVVDDGCSTPVTLKAWRGELPLTIIRNSVTLGAARSRNKAIAVLGEQVDAVGFIDDDARLCPQWLKIAKSELTEGRGAVTGPVKRFDAGLVSLARQLRYDKRYAEVLAGQAVDFLAGGNSLIRRDLLDRAGGFPEIATMSDRMFVRRLEALGARCHYVPEMYILHRNSKGLMIAIREAWRAGILDDSVQSVSPRRRLVDASRKAIAGSNKAASLLNVFLDAIYLTARARTSRRPVATVRSSEST